jgi:hypothetical protein
MGTQTPLRHASERDHRQSHTVSIEAQLESLHNSSQEALHDKDVIIKSEQRAIYSSSGFDEVVLELQDQVDEMLRIEHNNLQVANLRLLQLRQQVAPGTPPERIVVTWHEDVLGELTKAYLTERLQTRSLFDVGWKRGRDEAKDEEEDLEAVDVSERISKRARLEEEGKGKEREEAV